MKRIEGHIQVAPPVYEIELGLWRWCKLDEVCTVASELKRVTGHDFNPTPEELVSRFAALVRPNKVPEHLDQEKGKKKIFRYSMDGVNLWSTEVPAKHPAPPYVPFELGIGTPYPKGLFVPEGWAIDTLKAVRLGAVAAAEWGESKVGFAPGGSLIVLEGEKFAGIYHIPECVRT